MTNSLDRVCEAVVRLVASVLSGSVAIIFLLAPEICAAASSRGDAERPNIIIILVDDLGWADLPSYGNRFHETPRLDRFAAEGMRFTSAYAAPACSPARAALMTGQSAARAGIYDWIPGHWRPFEALRAPVNRTQHLPRDLATIGEVLRARGYATAMFGKWHLGHAPEEHPLRRGFDEANVGTGYYNVCFDPPREDSSEKIMSDRLTDFALDFIERQSGAGKPFFLFLSHWDVHVPFDAEPALIDKYLKKPRVIGYPCHAAYAAMIEQLDRSTGRLLEQLDALGLEKETLVVFTSDNGGQISNEAYHSTVQHGQPGGRMKLMLDESRSHAIHAGDAREYIATSNAPLRGEKGTLYEGGIRVPLLARWCGKIPAGSTSDALAILEDWFPTLLEVAGGGSGKFTKQAIDGVSLIPVLMEAAAPHPERALFWHYPVYHHGTPAAAVRRGPWKLIRDFAAKHDSLYELDCDLSETTDLGGVFPKIKTELADLLDQWLAETAAALPQPNPRFDASRRLEWGPHPDASDAIRASKVTQEADDPPDGK